VSLTLCGAGSATGWTDIPGTTFTAVTEGQNTQYKNFIRTKRYVRYVGTLTGSTAEFSLAVAVGAF